MTQPCNQAQLAFLQRSARLLSNQSPSTSAYLMNVVHQSSLNESNAMTVAQHNEACLSCGTLRVPGITCKTFTRPRYHQKSTKRKHQSRPKPSESDTRSSEVVFKCMRCDRETSQRLPKHQRHHLPVNKIPHATALTSTPSTSQALQPEPVVPETSNLKSSSTNAGSKKRAKARKQQGLLASLSAGKLRQQGQQSQTSPALDLLDFFQSS